MMRHNYISDREIVADRKRRERREQKRKRIEAAAPDLFAAIPGLLEIAKIAMPDTYFASDSRVKKAKAALAKAERRNDG